MWESTPRSILLLKKLGAALLPHLLAVARFLGRAGARVYVERDVLFALRSLPPQLSGGGERLLEQVHEWAPGPDAPNVDLALCLGGDGVILHASSLFQGPCPPVLGFNLGSLGFLSGSSSKSR